MPRSSRQERGSGGRQDQKVQGNEVPGGDRWPGSSAGKLYRLCLARWDEAPGKCHRGHQNPKEGAGKTKEETQASDWRQDLRQRSAQKTTQKQRHKSAFDSSEEPPKRQEERRPTVGSLQETIYSRAHLRLAQSLQTTDSEIRESYQYVRGFLGTRVRYVNPEKMLMRFCNHF